MVDEQDPQDPKFTDYKPKRKRLIRIERQAGTRTQLLTVGVVKKTRGKRKPKATPKTVIPVATKKRVVKPKIAPAAIETMIPVQEPPIRIVGAPASTNEASAVNRGVGKYATEIEQLLVFLGGSKNISSGTHCVSRVRLVMKDMNLVDIKGIEQLPSTKGTIKLPNNQFHIIIGTDVPAYYKELARRAGLREATKEEVKQDAAGRGNWFQRAMQHLSEIFIPLIPVIVAAGLILGLRNIFETNFDGFRIVDSSAFMKGLNDFLWIPAQAGLWFIPVYICWSVFKKMGGSPIYGIFIGLTLLIPPLLNVYDVSSNGLKWIWDLDLSRFGWNFGNFQFPWKIAYTAQVIPAIGVAFFGVYAERLFTEITTPVLRQVVVPLLTLLSAYVVGAVIIGPIGWTIGTAISFAVQWALTHEIARWFFGPIFGFFYAPLVITGLHHMLNAVMTQDAGTIGGTIVFPILAISNIGQGTAALAFALIHRTPKVKQVAFSATASAYLGVTEPAMYGINLRYLYPFIASCIGTALGSLMIVGTGVSAAGIGNGAWLGALTIQASSPIPGYTTAIGTGYTWFILSALVVVLFTGGLTYLFRKVPRFIALERRIGVN